ncbi:hypothetical protein L3X38_023770 [Prunus dulcis]|uniref:Uncharacterized protein n=1 Tax=Prunus dulcis TaxID=3755 RepID=A0AAD4Z6C7_PRUDU|nr:hypothetical protein L3X38_023770 [Prunus dulcis]
MGLRHVSRLTHFPGRHGKVREFSHEKIEKLGAGPLPSTLCASDVGRPMPIYSSFGRSTVSNMGSHSLFHAPKED